MTMTKTQIRKKIRDIANHLNSSDCQFWACPGQKSNGSLYPHEDMATCIKCQTVRELRKLAREL